MSGILNEPVQLLPCPICSQPTPANVVLRHKEAASQGNGRREETVDCDADMYALWCDTCREHPSKCPRRAALSRVPTADNAIYEPIIGNGVKALDRRESVILPRTDTRTDGVPTGGEAETIDDALFREWPEGCARPVDAGALHAETATRSAVQTDEALSAAIAECQNWREAVVQLRDLAIERGAGAIEDRCFDILMERPFYPRSVAQAVPDPFMEDYKRDTIAGLIEHCAELAETYSDQGRDGHQIAKAIRALTLPSAQLNTPVCTEDDGTLDPVYPSQLGGGK